jgi:hypothetical protein
MVRARAGSPRDEPSSPGSPRSASLPRLSEALGSLLAMSHEARRRRRRWRRLRRDLSLLAVISADADEVMPDFVLSRDGLTAVASLARADAISP